MIKTIITAETTVSGTLRSEYVLAPDVALVLVRDGTGRLIDMGGTFYALSVTATAMLDEALRVNQETAVAHLAARYQIEEQRIRGDLRRFMEILKRKGLIRHRSHAPHGDKSRRRLASVLLLPILHCIHAWPMPVRGKAKALLGLAYLSLRLFGLSHTIATWQQYHRHGRPTISCGDREMAVHEVDKAVRDGAAYHFLNPECKERALCCWSLLCAQGLPARLVFGIDLYPFTGHCWCQLDRQILTDYEDRCERFTPVLTYT